MHRRRDHGHATGRRDAVLGLHLLRVGSARHRRGEAALARGDADPDGDPPAVGRRVLRRAVPLAEPRVVVRAHPGPQVRLPRDAGGREGVDHQLDRGSESRPLLRAQASLPPDQGRGAGRALHDADRQGAHSPRGRRPLGDHVGRDGLHGRGGGAATLRRRRFGRDRRPAHGDAVGQGGRARVGAQDVEGARAARGHANRRLRRRDRGDDRGGGVRGPRRAGEADHGARHARSVLAAAREGVHSRRSTTSSPGSGSSRSTDGDHVRPRRRHAPDGRVRLGRDDHEVAQAGRRHRRAGREPARDLDGQGRHRGAVSGRRRRAGDPRPGRRDRRGRHEARDDRARRRGRCRAGGAGTGASRARDRAGGTRRRVRIFGGDACAERERNRRRPQRLPPTGPTAGRSSRRSSRRSRPSTGSIPRASKAPAAAVASRRRTSSRSSSPARRQRLRRRLARRAPDPVPQPAPPSRRLPHRRLRRNRSGPPRPARRSSP